MSMADGGAVQAKANADFFFFLETFATFKEISSDSLARRCIV